MIGSVRIELATVDSTNKHAADLLRLTEVQHGTVILAHEQTQGRGQRDRSWHSEPGLDLTFSVVLRPAGLAAGHQFVLAQFAALAVRDALLRSGLQDVQVKWPNDVLVGPRKVAGILIQNELQGGLVRHAVVGIGLNVNQEASDFAGELAESATSLQLATGKPWPADELLNDVVEHYRAGYQVLLEGGVEKLRQQYLALDSTVGRAVQVEAPDGAWSGRAATVDEHGALWVEDAAGDARKIIVGDISIRVEA
ncbi:MAG: biotin--[acetyl-CoA-carboxylase] ligase [Flavobacteriales bacterium]|nr:biotin--[acetyl-CoA-carboxylase] ligase [Flavobacteriales bacterium]